jgi:hypothetical protein
MGIGMSDFEKLPEDLLRKQTYPNALRLKAIPEVYV